MGKGEKILKQIHICNLLLVFSKDINVAKYLNGFPSADVQNLRNEEQGEKGTNRSP